MTSILQWFHYATWLSIVAYQPNKRSVPLLQELSTCVYVGVRERVRDYSLCQTLTACQMLIAGIEWHYSIMECWHTYDVARLNVWNPLNSLTNASKQTTESIIWYLHSHTCTHQPPTCNFLAVFRVPERASNTLAVSSKRWRNVTWCWPLLLLDPRRWISDISCGGWGVDVRSGVCYSLVPRTRLGVLVRSMWEGLE